MMNFKRDFVLLKRFKKKKNLCFKMSVIVFQGQWWEMPLVRWECILVFKVTEARNPSSSHRKLTRDYSGVL